MSLSNQEVLTVLEALPVHHEDRSMVDAAVASDNWAPVQRWLRFRMDSGKNYTRTLKVAQVWWWHSNQTLCSEFGRLLVEWVREKGAPAC